MSEAPPPTPPPAPPEPQPPPERAGFMRRYAGLPIGTWTAGSVGVGVGVAIVALFIGTIVVAIFDPQLESTAAKDCAQLVVALALGGTAIGFALADGPGRLRDALARLGIARLAFAAIGLALLAWLIYLLCALVLNPLLSPSQQDVTQELGTNQGSGGSLLVAGLLIMVAAPVSEELFFRGFMFAGLRRSIPLWPAAVISALVWGSLHLSGGNVGVALQLAVFGVILAWLYERSGSLWSPILAHALNNTIAFVLLVS